MSENLFDFSAFENAFEQAVVDENDGSGSQELPDGNYQVTIEKFTLKENKKKPAASDLGWHFKILSGDYTGRVLYKNCHIDPNTTTENRERTMKYLKTDLTRVKHPITKINDLPTLVESGELLGMFLEVCQQTGKTGNRNIYINKVLDEADLELES